MSGGRRRQAGAETLEFTAVVGLLGIVAAAGVRSLGLLEQQLRVQDDARTLARDAAMCERSGPALTLSGVDPRAPSGASALVTRPPGGLVAVTVTFPGLAVMPAVGATTVMPRATVTMRREPGCP